MLKLREWKNTSGHKPLIVKGCSDHIGKNFAKRESSPFALR